MQSHAIFRGSENTYRRQDVVVLVGDVPDGGTEFKIGIRSGRWDTCAQCVAVGTIISPARLVLKASEGL